MPCFWERRPKRKWLVVLGLVNFSFVGPLFRSAPHLIRTLFRMIRARKRTRPVSTTLAITTSFKNTPGDGQTAAAPRTGF